MINLIRKYILESTFSTYDDDESWYATEPGEISELSHTMFGMGSKLIMVNGHSKLIRSTIGTPSSPDQWIYAIVIASLHDMDMDESFERKVKIFSRKMLSLGYITKDMYMLNPEDSRIYPEVGRISEGDVAILYARKTPLSSGSSHNLRHDLLLKTSPHSDIRGELPDSFEIN